MKKYKTYKTHFGTRDGNKDGRQGQEKRNKGHRQEQGLNESWDGKRECVVNKIGLWL